MTRPTLADLVAARERLAGVAQITPVLSSGTIGGLVGRPVSLKAENLQLTGSFKIRGAYNTIAQLTEAEREAGVVTASAGNHGQAVAWAARQAGIAATIFVPEGAPMAKVDAARGYGATVTLAGEGFDDAVAAGRRHVEETGATFVHAFDDPRVIAGPGDARPRAGGAAAAGAGHRRDPDRRRRPRVGDRDRAAGRSAGAVARRRPGSGVRAVRRAGADRSDDRGRDRREVSRRADLGDPPRSPRRGRRRRRRGDLAGARAAARALEARRRGCRRRARRGAAAGARPR